MSSLAGEALASDGQASSDKLKTILESHAGLAEVLRDSPQHRLQVVLGLIEEDKKGNPILVQHGFRLGAEYFYPASSIKLFAAIAALQQLERIRQETRGPFDLDTPLIFHPLCSDESEEKLDPSNLAGGHITVRHEIRKLFLVSNNTSFNRLYEFVGQDGLASTLTNAGLSDARIVHRLSEARTPEENLKSPRIDLINSDSKHTLPERMASPLPSLAEIDGIEVGSGYFADGERVDEPMNFSLKNRISLSDLQKGLCMVVRPEIDCGGAGFKLKDPDREVLLEAMSQFPGDSKNPVYDRTEYSDDLMKFFLSGVERVVPKESLRIYNKVGQAYGFTTENSWVVHKETGRSFFLTATLYTNENQLLNDDDYEYATVALPFLADLGEAVTKHLWGDP